MTFSEYQEAANKTAIYKHEIANMMVGVSAGIHTAEALDNLYKIQRTLQLCYAVLGLGEVGEVQGKIKKIIRDAAGNITEETRMKVAQELGDVLWYVAQVCDELNISMGMVAETNVAKLKSRAERGVIKGSGDER